MGTANRTYNVSQEHTTDLPEIRDGESCVPGEIYKVECNTCKCGENNSLVCTKMGCPVHGETGTVFLNSKKNLRKMDDEVMQLPELPKGKCKPGRLYKKICQTCYCNYKGRGVCTDENDACHRLRTMMSIRSPEDVGLKLTEKSMQKLPSLPHTAAKCDPGMVYRVDCNSCLCLSNRNMMCTTALCINYEDMNRIASNKLHGKPCKSIKDLKTANQCLKCACVAGKFKCEPIVGCKSLYRKSLHGPMEIFKPRLQLNMKSDMKCQPTSVYTDNCNRCYCQDSGYLRCTLKICPTYVQTLILKKQLLQLEKEERLEEEIKRL